jgi:polysaccharide chain length determinant protein (PEP-CTERM system associated)
MDQLIRQLNAYLRGMWHRRWIGVAVAWIVALGGAVAVLRIPDRYEASARVYVDTDSVLRPLLSGLAVQPDLNQRLTILSRTLISRPNVEKLIRMTDMDLALQSPEQRDRLIDTMTRQIRIASAGRDNLYTLAYRDSDPDQAKRIVQSLLSVFMESSLGDKRQDTDSARRFIEDQIKGYEKRLEEAENRLKEFKLRNIAILGPEGRDYFSRVGQLDQDLEKAQLELRAAEEMRDSLKREVAGEEPVFLAGEGAGSGPVSELDLRIADMKKQLDELRRRFTERHPDVVGTKRVIEQLEQERKQEVANRIRNAQAPGNRSAGGNGNPVLQQLRFALAEAEANVASLRGRVAELRTRQGALKAAARQQPQLEAELAQLNRDYDVQKRQYESLVTRRESAAISSEMDTAGAADFRIIDPPRASTEPVAPQRPLLLAMVLLGALAAGAGASFLMSQIRPTFHDTRGLRAMVGRPVLGSVSRLTNPAMVRQYRRANLAFGASMAGLLVLYGAWLAWLATYGRAVTGG